MSWFLISILILNLSLNVLEARHVELPAAVIVGTVYCDTCFQVDFTKSTRHFISGATVAVECKGSESKPDFQAEAKTDKHGEFRVHLPFPVTKHVKKIEGCSVKLASSSQPFCAVASTATSSSLHLKSREQNRHIFSAGFFTFRPLNQPNLCNQKPKSIKDSKGLNSMKSFLFPGDQNPVVLPTPIQNPTIPNIPPIYNNLPPLNSIPLIPGLPQLPNLPNLPPIPGLPKSNTETANKFKSSKTFFPPVNNPGLPSPGAQTTPNVPPFYGSFLPPLPPLPQLPPLPPLPTFPGFATSLQPPPSPH